MKCINPYYHEKVGFPVACRECDECKKINKLEWSNRMMLESYGIDYRPLFLTLTYDSQHYVDNPAEILRKTQLFFKRLRRRGYSLRYFCVIERGENSTKRLHNHAILWCRELSLSDYRKRFYTIHNAWSYGAIQCPEVRSKAGLHYVSKYIQKNLDADLSTMSHISEYDKKSGKLKKSGRIYTYSNNPMLGDNGINAWKNRELQRHFNRKRTIFNPPSNKLPMFFNGKLVNAYIPLKNYIDFCKSIGVDFQALHNDDAMLAEVQKWQQGRGIKK